MILFILGLLDLLAGTIILLSPDVFFSSVMKYVGLILLGKGMWSVVADIQFLLSR